MLRADDLILVCSHDAVKQISHLDDDDIMHIQSAQHVLTVHSTIQAKQDYFAALSQEMTLLEQLPAQRFVLTTFVQYPHLHWCWNEVKQLSAVRLSAQALPPVLLTERTPVKTLVALDNARQGFYCRPNDIVNYALTPEQAKAC